MQTWAIDTDLTTLVGSGAYKLSRYLPAERLAYDRNPFYFVLLYLTFPRSSIKSWVRLTALCCDSDRRKLMLSPKCGVRIFQILKRFEKQGKFQIYPLGEVSSRSFMMFNLNRGKNKAGKPFVDPVKSAWFNDVNFRRAIAYAIDRSAMINTYYRGLGAPQDSPIPAISPYHFLAKMIFHFMITTRPRHRNFSQNQVLSITKITD
ncbi:MAG: hypothetical protein HC895_15020 [Leptolyngbyaceae cyanobacterium SM1_3_5]|nr:hypothetical protein [Leptolyngbyaceae cyanobacterium SM1_3_5]